MSIIAEKGQISGIRQEFIRLQKSSLLLRSEDIGERKKRLQRVLDWILANRTRIQEAIFNDFKKPPLEVDISEIFPIVSEIRHVLKHLELWSKPKKIDATITYLGTWSEVRYEPKGLCLILSPWNFPFNLCIGPLVSCLAAGNAAIIKPSEVTPHTSGLIKEMIQEIFDGDPVSVVEGGTDAASYLLGLPFDHIFFTGSPAIGKIVMKAAAESLASVTLELGGKSPTIVDKSANIAAAARRIAFGKFLNNGQTCIAPDYILVHEQVKEEFLTKLKESTLKLFGNAASIDELSPSYSRIVNGRHFERVNQLIQDAIQRGAKVEMTGLVNPQSNFIHPTILTDVPLDAQIMQDEIFGPALPVLTFAEEAEVINLINSKPKPLALYIFGSNKKFRESVLKSTSAGTVCINDCITQFTHPNLPFGGVNNSGIGKAHGHYGFLAFSNEKPILRSKTGFSLFYLFHPPFTKRIKAIVDLLLRWF